MTWRIARSILALRAEVDALAPNRNKASDGTIGDASHAARTSDHNPYITDANGVGVVRAVDITHDPKGGLDAARLAEHVRQLGAKGDPRVRYVIWNRRIASPTGGWSWRTYTGSNPHTKHVHISVSEGAGAYDSDAPWGVAKGGKPAPWVRRDELPLRKGDRDGKKKLVSKLQKQLGTPVTGRFGRATQEAVKKWQSRHDGRGRAVGKGEGLAVDGVVGPKTWAALFRERGDAPARGRGDEAGERPREGAAAGKQTSGKRPAARATVRSLAAEFKRLESESESAWERLVAHGSRRAQMAAESREKAESRDVAGILLRIEAKLGTLVEQEETEGAGAQAGRPAESRPIREGALEEGGTQEKGAARPQGAVTQKGLAVQEVSSAVPGGNGSGGATLGIPDRPVRLADLSDDELSRRIEALGEMIDRSRDALIGRYLAAEKELAGASRPQGPATEPKSPPRRRPRSGDGERVSRPGRGRKEDDRKQSDAQAASEDVRGLQRDLNRFTQRFLKDVGPILVDGVYGPSTKKRIVTIKYHLGYAGKAQRSPDVTPEFLRRLRHPRSARHASAAMLARAAQRRRAQRKHARRSAAPKAGVGKFDDRPVASWLVPHLEWARREGWRGTLISGYRDPEHSERVCLEKCGAPSCPGTCAGRASNHSGKVQPAGAVDITEHVQFAELIKRCPHSPRIFNALGPADPNHFSASGR